MSTSLGIVALAVSATLVAPPKAATTDEALAAVRRALAWIESNARPVAKVEGAMLFPGISEMPSLREANVYSGNAGILIFLENAAAVLDDDHLRKLADETAAGILSLKRADADGKAQWRHSGMPASAGLYTGDAGIGQAFLVRARLRHDEAALREAIEIGDALLSRAEHDDAMLYWDEQVDIVYGAAGTALFLLELGEETKEKRFLDAAKGAGLWLIDQSVSKDSGDSVASLHARLSSWRFPLTNQFYVNFSHGTAGVAYALFRIGDETGDEKCTHAALEGANWLLAQGVLENDLLRWPVVEGEKQCMGGWCHGPPGTARLFLLLHARTKEKKYLDAALASARWVMSQAGDADHEVGPHAFPPTLCCGVAGVIDFFCDLYRATGDPQYKEFAARAGAYLIADSTAEGDGLKWANGANAHGSGTAQHNVDLMQGASGEALALLRLATIDRKVDPIRHLPDRSVK